MNEKGEWEFWKMCRYEEEGERMMKSEKKLVVGGPPLNTMDMQSNG